ncbi:hypothetical protein MJ923_05895 [Shewanella sp. 3B26]|jgi:phage shock protein A|uniref:Flagella biosynthesis chaperone for FliD, FliT n=1 Tax=Shewanella zhuhaiensis TaxID=2919576 RepID=A0AAJ1BHE5_9GAMM|nr:hypothetical protein [Shewanella zhuhaiensis]MCH4293834.1 hypothetical protein [Shewanella zhuhaiensis]
MTQAIREINSQLQTLFAALENITAEDERCDDLVSQLQETIVKRQFLLQNLTDADGGADKAFLEAQLMLSQRFMTQARALKDHRQQILHASSKSKRQLNVYRTIDANR